MAIPEQLRRELARYGNTITSALQAAKAERNAAAVPRTSPEFIKNLPTLARAVQVVPILLMFATAIILGDSQSGQAVGPFVLIGSITFSLAIFLYLQRKKGHAVQPLSGPDVGAAVCAQCGVSQAFVAGRMTDVCRSCGAARLPTPEITAKASSAAAAMVFRERVDRWRMERGGWASFRHRDGAGLSTGVLTTEVIVTTSLVVVTVLILVSPGKNKSDNLLMISPVAILVGLATARAITTRVSRSRAWAKVIRVLVNEQGASHVGASAWIDTRWAGPVTNEILYGDWAYHALAFHVAGYDALLVVNTEPVRKQTARIMILIAAWTPGVSDQEEAFSSPAWLHVPLARELHERLASCGFDVEVVAAGIMAAANRDRLAYIRHHPEYAVELAAVVDDVVELASAIGARPVAEMLQC